MESPPSYQLNAQIIALYQSSTPHIIVEGVTDKSALGKLLNRYRFKGEQPSIIEVEQYQNAEALRGLGSRDRVCTLVSMVSRSAHSKHAPIFALIDREFDNFDFWELRDHRPFHESGKELYWTRGHSIENYLFNRRFIEGLIEEFVSDPETFALLCQTMDTGWLSLCQKAASLSELCRQVPIRFESMVAAIRHEAFVDENKQLSLPLVLSNLRTQQAWSSDEYIKIDARLSNLYASAVSGSETFCAWFSHGHLMTRVIYSWLRCWSTDDRVPQQTRRLLKNLSEDKFFNSLMHSWALKHSQVENGYPDHLFRALGIGPDSRDLSQED